MERLSQEGFATSPSLGILARYVRVKCQTLQDCMYADQLTTAYPHISS